MAGIAHGPGLRAKGGGDLVTDVRVQRLVGHSAIYSLATIAPIIAGLAIIPAITRRLGAEEYGVAATCLVLVQVMGLLATLGLPASITRHALIERSGMSGAARLVLLGAGLAGPIVLVGALASPLWSQAVTGVAWRPAIVLAICAGGSLSVVTAHQSLTRAQGRPWRFVTVAAVMSILGQGVALGMIALSARAEFYLLGLALTYATLAVILIVDAARLARVAPVGRGSWIDDATKALRIGLLTLPHGLAMLLTSGLAVLLASVRMGSHAAGQLQLILLLGGAPALALAALNNAWAPTVYAQAKGFRGSAIMRTAPLVLMLVAVLSIVVSLSAPFALAVLAPASLLVGSPTWAVAFAAAASLPAAVYLSNVHLLFAEGRAGALAWMTPTSLAVSTGVALAASSRWGLAGLAGIPLCFYTLQAFGVGVVRRRVSSEQWSERALTVYIVPAAIALTAIALIPSSTGLTRMRLATSLLLVAVCAVWGVRWLRSQRGILG